MIKINENFLNLQDNYLFSTVRKKVEEYKRKYPNKEMINLGIGDVTKPLPKAVTEAMKKACSQMEEASTFKGYGPEQGYEFLREKIAKEDYQKRGIAITKEEIFISDGAKCDCSNISDILALDNKVAIPDPVYPVYLDTNVMAGRSRKLYKRRRKI